MLTSLNLPGFYFTGFFKLHFNSGSTNRYLLTLSWSKYNWQNKLSRSAARGIESVISFSSACDVIKKAVKNCLTDSDSPPVSSIFFVRLPPLTHFYQLTVHYYNVISSVYDIFYKTIVSYILLCFGWQKYESVFK